MRDRVRRGSNRRVLFAAVVSFFVSTAIAAGELPLAIQGYDPVAYFTVGEPVQGLARFEYEWDEQRYRFSRAEHRELFRADPLRYAPQFANLCAMALARGETVDANPRHWLISEGRLYLFGKETGPAMFAQDLDRNAAKAQQNRPLR